MDQDLRIGVGVTLIGALAIVDRIRFVASGPSRTGSEFAYSLMITVGGLCLVYLGFSRIGVLG